MSVFMFFCIGPISDSEGESSEAGPSPCVFGTDLQLGLVRPTPVRVSCVRRTAVEKLEDLLKEVEEDKPLDLSLKRPKMT